MVDGKIEVKLRNGFCYDDVVKSESPPFFDPFWNLDRQEEREKETFVSTEML